MFVIAAHGAMLYFLLKQQFISLTQAIGNSDGQFYPRTQAEG